MTLPIAIRPMEAGDRGYITLSWLRSHRPTCSWLSSEDYSNLYRIAIARTLDHAHVLVAEPKGYVRIPGKRNQFHGWICGEPSRGLLHYVFVKSDHRRLGLGTRLLAELAAESERKLTATHWTRDWSYLEEAVLLDGYRPDLFDPKETKRHARENRSDQGLGRVHETRHAEAR